MATAYAKFSGKLGVCIATSGPGASHLITGLYDTLLDHEPVLAIVDSRPAMRSVATISKSSISSRCSRTSAEPRSNRHLRRPRSAI